MMNYYPEALLSRSQSSNSSWPLPEQALVYKNQYVIDESNTNHATRTSEGDTLSMHRRRRPIRVYHASPYDISPFLQALERVRHRSVNINDILVQIPSDSVPPYTQEILYLINNNYFHSDNLRFPPIKLVPHTSKTVSGFSLAWLTTDFYGKKVFHENFPESSRESSSGVIGLCSIFYLPLGSLDAMRRRTSSHGASHLHKAHWETTFAPRDSECETILSEIYQSCREYQVRYCVLTDSYDSKVIELFQDSYMDHHSPYDIILFSDNDHRSVPLTLGGLLWDVLLSVCHDVRDSLSMNG